MNDQKNQNIPQQPDDLRQARQQARQRRRRQLLITRTLIVLGIALLVALVVTVVAIKLVADQKSARGEKVRFLAVKDIEVKGDTRYTDEEILRASKLYEGQSLLSVNKVKAHDALLAALPYLETVKIGNDSFYELYIEVTEVPVMAAVQMGEEWMILGDNNRALELVSEQELPADLLRIVGASFENKAVGKDLLDERSWRICKALVVAADRYGLENMTTVNVETKTKIFILLDERMQVVMGYETNLTNQVKVLVDILPALYENNGRDAAGRLDMIFYSDDTKDNDKAIYTPQELLEELEQAEKKPMAAVQVENGWRIINGDNLVLETMPADYLPEGLVQIVGATVHSDGSLGKELLDSRSRSICTTLISGAAQTERISLSSIDITDRTAITLTLEGGMRVLLGNSSALEAQLEALDALLPSLWEEHGEDAAGVLDMTSYSDGNDSNDTPVYQSANG